MDSFEITMYNTSMEKVGELTGPSVAPEVECSFFSEKEWRREKVAVPGEMPLTIFVNGQELATVLCTPSRLTQLVLGFLYLEGIIKDKAEVASLRVCEEEPVADVRLVSDDFTVPPRRVLTSGCGQGASFEVPASKIVSDMTVSPDEILALMKLLYQQQALFQQMGGIHSSALADRQRILVLAEDIGRHNTLDKVMGECLLRGIPTEHSILLTTGRISSEMVTKAARMRTPVVVSRGTPTERAVMLGRELDISIIGYARGNRLSVFSAEERLHAK
jgi:FdhD protein